jgi:hypothetical protein
MSAHFKLKTCGIRITSKISTMFKFALRGYRFPEIEHFVKVDIWKLAFIEYRVILFLGK